MSAYVSIRVGEELRRREVIVAVGVSICTWVLIKQANCTFVLVRK